MTATLPAPAAVRWWPGLDAVFDRPASVRSLAVLRIVLGPVVVLHLWPFLASTLEGRTYRDTFFEPWWSFAPVPPGWVQVACVWGGVAAAVALTLGWRTRLVAPATWLGVTGNLFLSQHHFRHNRAFLVLLLAAVALSDSGRVLSLDARRRRCPHDRATVWPLWLLRALVSSVYLASGASKLLDPDWVGGRVLWDRAVRYQHLVHDRLPDLLAGPVVDVVTARWVHAVTSPVAVAMELFIAFALWHPRTRLAAIWTAIAFHLSIEVAASVEVFSVAAIVALAIWATPATRDRVVVVADGRWVRRLDWLARFEVREVPGAELSVTDRDGRVRTGAEARWLLRSRLPALFPVVAPPRVFSLLRGHAGRG